ncbi:type IV toxin-antitoxin system AbiEi family antitoxin domain-containing protein [Streptococcus orisasini]|uniref:type IV toxin-antitoxin system AbiEi family antitoxin domain-containing protein n=1 Tax=Streptococcus orisasini TaxID=1080071 RepID=UPI000709A651|nr:type IV toxin-antitoxin system AbiEi family antitoxin domain-containing protein [Streptococcus orisasini]
MDLLEKPVYRYIKHNHGVITFREIEELHFSYQELKQLVAKGSVESVERGIYHLPDTYIDDFFSLQYRFPKGIYSLETALWLHGLSLIVPFEPVMTFPFGTNTTLIKKAGIKPIIVRSHHEIGRIKLERQAGQWISVYDMERTLVECLRTTYHHIDIQMIAPAFKRYFEKENVNLPKLVEYAKLFKVEKKLYPYIEVLS